MRLSLISLTCASVSMGNHTAHASSDTAVRTGGWTGKSNCRRPANVIVADHQPQYVPRRDVAVDDADGVDRRKAGTDRARSEAFALLEQDPQLAAPEHATTRAVLDARWAEARLFGEEAG